MLSSGDFFSRSTGNSPDPLGFSAGLGGNNFERFFQTFGCLVSRHGRLFVESLNREGDQSGTGTVFLTKQTSNGLSDLAGLHFVAGKNETFPGEWSSARGRDPPFRLIVIDPWERIDDRFNAAEFHVGRTRTGTADGASPFFGWTGRGQKDDW